MWFLWYFDREQDHCRIYVYPTSLKTTTFHIEITWKNRISTHFNYTTVSEVCAKFFCYWFPYGMKMGGLRRTMGNPSHFHALYLNSETKNPLHILLLPLFVVKDASPMSAFCEKEKIMKIG